jgi:hypothetical protein
MIGKLSDAALRELYLSGRRRYCHLLQGKMGDFYAYTGGVQFPLASQSFDFKINLQGDSFFLVEGIQLFASHVWGSGLDLFDFVTVQVSDTTYGQPWSNEPVHAGDLAGWGGSRKLLSHPFLLRPSSQVTFSFTNNSVVDDSTGSDPLADNATVYAALVGRKVNKLSEEDAAFILRRMWYQYALRLPDMTAGSVGIKNTVQVFNDSDFVCQKWYGTALINFLQFVAGAADGTGCNEVLLRLRDITADAFWISKKTAASLLLGTQFSAGEAYSAQTNMARGAGFNLPKPLFVSRNSVIEGEFDNLTGIDFPTVGDLHIDVGLFDYYVELTPFHVVMEGCRVF